MKNTLWHAHCPASWPRWARQWAASKGSLTQRLVALSQGFEIQLIGLNAVSIPHGPLTPPRPVFQGRMKQRLVRLRVGGNAVVLAQTLMHTEGPATDWHFWNGLGRRSLGSILFTDPQVKRSPLYFARLPFAHPWVQHLLETQAQSHIPKPTQRHWYARCARFERKPGRTPLWVMEVFLPSLNAFV